MAALTRRAKGVPLSLLIAKYFAYAFVLICAVWVASFTALSASMNAGAVYPANWGAAHAGETAKALQGKGRSTRSRSRPPTATRCSRRAASFWPPTWTGRCWSAPASWPPTGRLRQRPR